MQLKTCTKCKIEFPATLKYFYKNPSGKYGLTPRCKSCVSIDNKLSHEKRLKADPEKIRALANARAKKSYHNDVEKSRAKQREHQLSRRSDPVKGAIIKARKRADGAGLSPEEIQIIRDIQDNKCAICEEPNPTDLDHCHNTNKIRWLLCRHCNRGLGAFKDQPDLLRKAATLLERFTNA
jgi:hypothetical protein